VRIAAVSGMGIPGELKRFDVDGGSILARAAVRTISANRKDSHVDLYQGYKLLEPDSDVSLMLARTWSRSVRRGAETH